MNETFIPSSLKAQSDLAGAVPTTSEASSLSVPSGSMITPTTQISVPEKAELYLALSRQKLHDRIQLSLKQKKVFQTINLKNKSLLARTGKETLPAALMEEGKSNLIGKRLNKSSVNSEDAKRIIEREFRDHYGNSLVSPDAVKAIYDRHFIVSDELDDYEDMV